MTDLYALMSREIEKLVRDARALKKLSLPAMWYLRGFASACNRAARLREASEENGEHIPPFLIASITSNCNLFCAGCYARANNSCGEHAAKAQLSAARWGELFAEARQMGVSFVLLAGGEPLLRRDVLEQAAKEPDILFPIFTNGTLIDEATADFFAKHRNLVPVLSIEGGKQTTDERRGAGVFDKLLGAMALLKKRGILFGASLTATKRNLAEITSDAFVHSLSDAGSSLAFYVEYVPSDGNTAAAPDDADRALLDARMKELRAAYPMLFLSFPGDEKETGGCLAAGRGFFHVNADGSAEPCPFSPYSDLSVADQPLRAALQSRLFRKLAGGDFLLGEHTGGCHLFEQRAEVERMLSEG